MNKREKGDSAEQFVADYLTSWGYKCEIHPRTYKVIHLKGGKSIVVSSDNDYHNSFDVKAEGPDCMIYAQVKFMPVWYLHPFFPDHPHLDFLVIEIIRIILINSFFCIGDMATGYSSIGHKFNLGVYHTIRTFCLDIKGIVIIIVA